MTNVLDSVRQFSAAPGSAQILPGLDHTSSQDGTQTFVQHWSFDDSQFINQADRFRALSWRDL
jgi:hypothetical protein